jgi:hypothetical protein
VTFVGPFFDNSSFAFFKVSLEEDIETNGSRGSLLFHNLDDEKYLVFSLSKKLEKEGNSTNYLKPREKGCASRLVI